MSEDRTTEILRYVSAMAREFGQHRQEFNQFREEMNTRLGNVEGRLGGLEEQFIIFKHEQRQMSQPVSRIASAVMAAGADVQSCRTVLRCSKARAHKAGGGGARQTGSEEEGFHG